ncbi:MAG: PorP/SprF family type IX secretion system membrane protein [Bacteroidetes bacterium]|nr:PorP/SprF family type IX secretion system membrane protein [Bacteroidota bacterium]MBS1607638.1 PorP/SprF family type IX secretion system membrane protein [Bacteroidota bacterium]
MKKLICTLSICLSLGLCAVAQDPNFSQFFASPLTLNPALTGKFDGVYRVAGNYRNQWPTINNAFRTYTASFDMGILKNSIPEFDQFGIGFLGFADDAGNGVLKNNAFAMSLAYHKALDEDGFHQLGIGFQGAYVGKRLDVTKVTFEDQLTPSGFTGATSEVFPGQKVSVSYFDMNAGILYNGSTNGYNNFYVGASMYHINRPKESFQDKQYFNLSTRLTLQAGGKVRVGANNYVHMSANYSRQANATNTTVGGAYALNVNDSEDNPTNIYIGSWYRFGDAIIPYVGLEFGEFHIGATYDVNISSLKPGSNMRGGAEISLIYIKKPTDPNAKKLNCPKF